ncbi:hypothetical protein AVEN_151953-1 [Araneus ventricosus]|uniref:Uncharacterized protein n=1 Tax=Araneus ventricosus TaxID=182803 RepID=A0A4Y2GU23_ARAVE|nr:hypothetical protein AVEN_151953-1 [Araneus ventricosus]
MLVKLKKCCKSSSEKSGAPSPPYSPDLATNLGSKHLSGRRFSSNSDVKTAAENWFNGQGRDFYQAVLKLVLFLKPVLRSDNCLNRFGDYEERRSASMSLNILLYVLSIVNK